MMAMSITTYNLKIQIDQKGRVAITISYGTIPLSGFSWTLPPVIYPVSTGFDATAPYKLIELNFSAYKYSKVPELLFKSLDTTSLILKTPEQEKALISALFLAMAIGPVDLAKYGSTELNYNQLQADLSSSTELTENTNLFNVLFNGSSFVNKQISVANSVGTQKATSQNQILLNGNEGATLNDNTLAGVVLVSAAKNQTFTVTNPSTRVVSGSSTQTYPATELLNIETNAYTVSGLSNNLLKLVLNSPNTLPVKLDASAISDTSSGMLTIIDNSKLNKQTTITGSQRNDNIYLNGSATQVTVDGQSGIDAVHLTSEQSNSLSSISSTWTGSVELTGKTSISLTNVEKLYFEKITNTSTLHLYLGQATPTSTYYFKGLEASISENFIAYSNFKLNLNLTQGINNLTLNNNQNVIMSNSSNDALNVDCSYNQAISLVNTGGVANLFTDLNSGQTISLSGNSTNTNLFLKPTNANWLYELGTSISVSNYSKYFILNIKPTYSGGAYSQIKISKNSTGSNPQLACDSFYIGNGSYGYDTNTSKYTKYTFKDLLALSLVSNLMDHAITQKSTYSNYSNKADFIGDKALKDYTFIQADGLSVEISGTDRNIYLQQRTTTEQAEYLSHNGYYKAENTTLYVTATGTTRILLNSLAPSASYKYQAELEYITDDSVGVSSSDMSFNDASPKKLGLKIKTADGNYITVFKSGNGKVILPGGTDFDTILNSLIAQKEGTYLTSQQIIANITEYTIHRLGLESYRTQAVAFFKKNGKTIIDTLNKIFDQKEKNLDVGLSLNFKIDDIIQNKNLSLTLQGTPGTNSPGSYTLSSSEIYDYHSSLRLSFSGASSIFQFKSNKLPDSSRYFDTATNQFKYYLTGENYTSSIADPSIYAILNNAGFNPYPSNKSELFSTDWSFETIKERTTTTTNLENKFGVDSSILFDILNRSSFTPNIDYATIHSIAEKYSIDQLMSYLSVAGVKP